MKKRRIKSAIISVIITLTGAIIGSILDHSINHSFWFWFVLCGGVSAMYWLSYNDML